MSADNIIRLVVHVYSDRTISEESDPQPINGFFWDVKVSIAARAKTFKVCVERRQHHQDVPIYRGTVVIRVVDPRNEHHTISHSITDIELWKWVEISTIEELQMCQFVSENGKVIVECEFL